MNSYILIVFLFVTHCCKADQIEVTLFSDNALGWLNNFYNKRGCDASKVTLFASMPFNAWLVAARTFTDRRIILFCPQYRKLIEDGCLGLENKLLLLHEFGHIEQQKANALLDKIRDELPFVITDKKYTEAAAEVFACNHMSHAELLNTNKLYETGIIGFLSGFNLDGEDKFAQAFERVTGDTIHLNSLERYHLRKFVAHKKWLEVNKKERDKAEKLYSKYSVK